MISKLHERRKANLKNALQSRSQLEESLVSKLQKVLCSSASLGYKQSRQIEQKLGLESEFLDKQGASEQDLAQLELIAKLRLLINKYGNGSNADFARRCNTSVSQVHQKLEGYRGFGASWCFQIEQALGEPDYFGFAKAIQAKNAKAQVWNVLIGVSLDPHDSTIRGIKTEVLKDRSTVILKSGTLNAIQAILFSDPNIQKEFIRIHLGQA